MLSTDKRRWMIVLTWTLVYLLLARMHGQTLPDTVRLAIAKADAPAVAVQTYEYRMVDAVCDLLPGDVASAAIVANGTRFRLDDINHPGHDCEWTIRKTATGAFTLPPVGQYVATAQYTRAGVVGPVSVVSVPFERRLTDRAACGVLVLLGCGWIW